METTEWICDSCGELINSATDGWVEWFSGIGGKTKSLRLVHNYSSSPRNNKCQYSEIEERASNMVLSDMQLEYFLGADGLMRLLQFIHEGHEDTEEVLEMIKRLHIPGYEKARKHFRRAISEGVFEQDCPLGYHFQSDITRVNKWLDKQS